LLKDFGYLNSSFSNIYGKFLKFKAPNAKVVSLTLYTVQSVGRLFMLCAYETFVGHEIMTSWNKGISHSETTREDTIGVFEVEGRFLE
jgi:hypothetical protein